MCNNIGLKMHNVRRKRKLQIIKKMSSMKKLINVKYQLISHLFIDAIMVQFIVTLYLHNWSNLMRGHMVLCCLQ
jgi:hypothetical protein